MGALVEEDDDLRAGEKALATIRNGFATLASRGDWPLRLAFFISGLGEEPAVAKLYEEAVASKEGSTRSMSDIIAIAFETTLEARLSDTQFLVIGLALLAGGFANGAVWLLGASLGTLMGLG